MYGYGIFWKSRQLKQSFADYQTSRLLSLAAHLNIYQSVAFSIKSRIWMRMAAGVGTLKPQVTAGHQG